MKTVMCKKCGLVYRQPMPTNPEMNDYYKQGYYEEYKNIKNRNMFEIDEIIQNKKRELDEYTKLNINFDNKKVLDVGAGRGLMLDAINKNAKPAFIFGFEPSTEIVKWVRENMKYPFSVECYDLDSFLASESGGKLQKGYDIIICNGVLEHLPNPKKALTSLRTLLKEDGILLMRVPNEEPRQRFNLFKRISFVHLLYFTKETLSFLVCICGYKVENTVKESNDTELLFAIRQNTKSEAGNISKSLSKYDTVILYSDYLVNLYISPLTISFRRFVSNTLRHYLGNELVDRVRR